MVTDETEIVNLISSLATIRTVDQLKFYSMPTTTLANDLKHSLKGIKTTSRHRGL